MQRAHQDQDGGVRNRRGGGRVPPPAWHSENGPSTYEVWVQDLLNWSILASEMDAAQQCAAIIEQLGGEARNLARNLSFGERTQGGLVAGEMVDPVTYLLTHLAEAFAPLSEETRLRVTNELFAFNRR